MAIPSKEYWAERALKREKESYESCGILTDKLMQEYDIAARSIRKDISDFYAKYANKYGLSYDDAIRTLGKSEMREWKTTLKEYVERIAAEKDPEIKKKLTAQLDALSANSSITRLEALEGQIDMTLNALFDKGVAQMKKEFGDMFTEGYYKKSYDIQSRRGFFNEIAKISTDEVEHVISYPWSGAMFSDRLWQNKQVLVYNVREILTQGIIQGKSIDTMTQALANKMGQSYKVAERLIRTETNYIHNEASKAAYNAAGIEQYEFMATLSERTCDICGELDGKVFPVKDAVAGTNYPPMHPNCRCTTVEYDAEDAADRIASGEPMPKNMTYAEWKKRQDALHGEGYIDKERKKSYNEKADSSQYERYVNALDKNAPSTFKKFQEIKYSDNYGLFKNYAHDIKTGKLSALADFDLYLQTAQEVDNRLIGIVTSKGTKIQRKTYHFVSRIIGSIEDRRSGVSIEDVIDALTAPIKTKERKLKNGSSVKYFGKNAAVTIIPDSGLLVQANSR